MLINAAIRANEQRMLLAEIYLGLMDRYYGPPGDSWLIMGVVQQGDCLGLEVAVTEPYSYCHNQAGELLISFHTLSQTRL